MIRYEFIDSSIREEDIHPDFLFDKERELARNFVANLKMSQNIEPCPICGQHRKEVLFQKWGCQYAICPQTWTLSLASLPDMKTLKDYYYESELARFRASKQYQLIVSQRRKNLWESQIGWIEGRISRYLGNKKYKVVDWGSRSVGWLEILDTSNFVDELSVREPLPPVSESMGFDGLAEVVFLIDVLQREIQPQKFLEKVVQGLRPGGLLIAACRSGSGFDVLTLRESSESIFPLDHILLPSPNGMGLLFTQAGLDMLELTTPGLLDMQYVQSAGEQIPNDQYFLRYILEQGDTLLLERMQGFLQRNNLSSHLRCVARRR